LYKKVFLVVKDKEEAKQIVGMLVDPSQMEISDILNMFEDDAEL
jgi:polyadenylate-binding protein